MPTVLLIEDDAESRRATAELFLREDWKTLEAGDGEAGIRQALEHKPELILCDLLMPKANGFQVCRSLRQLSQRTKIVIVSGRDYGVDRTSAIEAGADEYLVKPISWESLREVIDRALPPSDDGATRSGSLPDFIPPATRVKFWGVRGSIPVPGSSTVGYGGNTSCVEVRADGEIIILDAGSGMRELGIALEEEFGAQPIRCTLLISHTHWDHIQGLPFFLPAYHQKNSLRVLGYEGARASLAAVLAGQMETSFFPVSLRDMPSSISIEELKEMEFTIGKVKVQARFVNHPGICVGYRLTTTNGTIAYFPDNEPYEVLKLSQGKSDSTKRAPSRPMPGASWWNFFVAPTSSSSMRSTPTTNMPRKSDGDMARSAARSPSPSMPRSANSSSFITIQITTTRWSRTWSRPRICSSWKAADRSKWKRPGKAPRSGWARRSRPQPDEPDASLTAQSPCKADKLGRDPLNARHEFFVRHLVVVEDVAGRVNKTRNDHAAKIQH